MEIELQSVVPLGFTDGTPVRAASAVVPFGDGFLIAQDDATHAAWWRDGEATPVRLLPPVDGLDVFGDATGTKHLKPDLEAVCPVEVEGKPAVLFLGSGSSPARMRSVLVRLDGTRPDVTVADLTPLYARVAAALDVPTDALNMEGACVLGDVLRWFHRGLPSAGLPSASVDLELAQVVAAASAPDAARAAAVVDVGTARHYDLGEVEGVGLAVTDAVALDDGSILLSAAAEDAPDPRDDGPVVGSALVRLEGHTVADSATLPLVDGEVCKVEGITVLDADETSVTVLGVVDADDPSEPSLAVRYHVAW